ncbi:TonB C-terminal domain-containing protein [Acinetobacter calcoaceticus]|uniref:TonB C-terminal domain-containing protein n=1 Tax=Acinetobacter calcoaceticus TaxID=471 RepID=UPI001E45B283|nr:TonB C-terminal domain-containing protein [Acinetobacter calcoaceticus]UGQ31491.1 TonB C-terminal domain-containing protein [Acinetobacter calcoaceticus]
MIIRYLISGLLFALSLNIYVHANDEIPNDQISKSVPKDLTAEARIKLYKNGSFEVVLTKSSGDPEQDEKILKAIRATNFKIFQEKLNCRLKYVDYPIYFTQPFIITLDKEE